MIEVCRTTDVDYIRRVLIEPATWRRETEFVVPVANVDDVLTRNGNIYYSVRNGESDCGFIALLPEAGGWHSLHICMRGLGLASQVEAASRCVGLARLLGISKLITAFPAGSRLFLRMAGMASWKRFPNFIATQFYNPVFKVEPVFYSPNS